MVTVILEFRPGLSGMGYHVVWYMVTKVRETLAASHFYCGDG